ncbi:uncharacterized protein LOC124279053 [Haliotis rubra]|uniref:uncharacterized protein LOC124279053 n=1 Tax=Haliotis rubra TaxID=36100 RepID=UPI001EE56755|nr:uncharacterized protein LOC124279053 [Haliotis rubra]
MSVFTDYTQDPYIVSPERVQYGSDVNLTCYILIEVKFLTFISFTWKKNDERLIHGGNYEISSGSGSFINSIKTYQTNTLTVKDTRMADEGKRYMCQVEVAVGTWSSSIKTEEYIFAQEVPSTTTTSASEGEDVTIFLTWTATDVITGFWSPSGGLIATIQSISVYIWPNFRSKVKVIRLITSHNGKTVKLMIFNVTKEDAGRYYFSDFKRESFYGGHNLVIADCKSTQVSTSIVPSTIGQTKPQTATPASITSASTQVDVTSNTVTVTSTQTSAATTTGIPLSTATTANTDQNVTTVVLYIIVGCCVLLIVLAAFIVAAIVLIRIKQQGVHQRRTPSTSTTSNIVQRQRYDVVECSPVDGAENSHLYAANSLGYHTLNFKRFNRVTEVDPTDANTTRNRLVPLDQDYEPVTLMDHRLVLNCTQQYSDHEEENNDSISLCSSYDNGQREKDRSGYAQCIVVAGNVPTMSVE